MTKTVLIFSIIVAILFSVAFTFIMLFKSEKEKSKTQKLEIDLHNQKISDIKEKLSDVQKITDNDNRNSFNTSIDLLHKYAQKLRR